MTNAKWLEGYSGQTVDQLLALAADHRIDSLVLAFEEALLQRVGELNEVERTVIAVEALEREVNNGGYHQLFLNRPEEAEHLVPSLRRIGCTRTAELTQKAVDLLKVQGALTASAVSDALERGGDALLEQLGEQCDGPYYDGAEPIDRHLFDYLARNRERIRLK
jgi:hypothetical protein